MKRHAITLLELLIALAVLAILLGLLAPAVQRVRARMTSVACAHQLKQIGLAVHAYHDQHQALPNGAWLNVLRPFINQDNTPTTRHLSLSVCGADSRGTGAGYLGLTWYVALGGKDCTTDGMLVSSAAWRVRLVDVTDGISTTLMIGERPPDWQMVIGAWAFAYGPDYADAFSPITRTQLLKPCNLSGPCPNPAFMRPQHTEDMCAINAPWSNHQGGAFFVRGDASVFFISYEASATFLEAAASRAGGETIDVSF